jgi:hypothetical protein
MSFREGGKFWRHWERKHRVEWKGRRIIFGAKEEEQKWKRGQERRASEVGGRRDGNWEESRKDGTGQGIEMGRGCDGKL